MNNNYSAQLQTCPDSPRARPQRKAVELPTSNQSILSVWQEQVTGAVRDPRLRQQLLLRERELLPRFAAQYDALNAMPRPTRRGLERRMKRSLAAVALLITAGAHPALAATISVGGTCTLVRAVVAANNDTTATGHCAQGRGADTIVLPASSTQTLTVVNNNVYGPTGLPVISTAITIDGNGSIIRRDSTAPAFRIFAVKLAGSSPGLSSNLRIQETTISGGVARQNPANPDDLSGSGGGILAYRGLITLAKCVVSGNRADKDGGGVLNTDATGGGYPSNITVINSTISGNAAGGRGGGLDNSEYSGATIANSTISGNAAGTKGGGVFIGYESGVTLTNSTISGNSSRDGGGLSTYGGGYIGLINSTVQGNRASGIGGGIQTDYQGSATLTRTLITGNTATTGREVFNDPNGTVTAGNFNIFGHKGLSNAQAFVNFTPGATDVTATVNGNTPTTLGAVLNTTLASNGGSTMTHASVAGSPAIDSVSDGACPPPTTDQRGVKRAQDGNGDGGPACDTGAYEFTSTPIFPLTTVKCRGVPATIIGIAADEILHGTAGNDVIQGLGGNDVLIGLAGNDTICGGASNDTIYGGIGDDRLYGEIGNEHLISGDGNDVLGGGFGNDRLDGRAGTDQCNGGPHTVRDSAVNCEQIIGVP